MMTLSRPRHVALFYHVLSHLDLGRDAANLYRPRGVVVRFRARRWSRPLLDAYRAAPGRLTVHGLPLIMGDLETLLDWLDAPRGGLDDGAGRQLCSRLADALREVDVGFELPNHDLTLPDELDHLHAELWAGKPRPELVIYDAPALRRGEFTHGRAVSLPDRQIVAVATSSNPLLAAIQVFHEATHAVTDPMVSPSANRDTAIDSAGYAQHLALERRAVEHGREAISRVVPEWSQAYARWCAQHGM